MPASLNRILSIFLMKREKFFDDFFSRLIVVAILGCILIDGFIRIDHHILAALRQVYVFDFVIKQVLEGAVRLDRTDYLVCRRVQIARIILINFNCGILGVLGGKASALLCADQLR